MDGDSDSVLVERLEVVQVGRRRRWSREEKLRIVAESYQGPRQVSAVARRYEISRAQLYGWRRALRGELGLGAGVPGFARAVIVADRVADGAGGSSAAGVVGRMEVVTAGGHRIVVGADVDGAAFARVLSVLEGRR